MGIRYAVKQRIEAFVISLAVHLIKVLIGQIAQPRHKGIAQQITQSKDVFREAVRIRVVFPQSQDRVVFQKAIEHIKRLARRAGYYPRAEHRILVGGVGVHGYRSLVIAKIARVIRGKQGALLDTKALAIGRGSNAFSPNPADGQLMMEIDQRGIGGFDGVLAQKSAGHMLEHIHSDTFRALAHRSDAEIRAMSNQRCQQGGIETLGAWFVSAERPERSREVRLVIDFAQQIFDPDAP
jgi:hypothetical protein